MAALPLVAILMTVGADRVLAQDSIGAGISATPVVLAQAARPGQTYALPDVTVANTGSEPSSYAVTVKPITGQRDVPADWVQSVPATVDLGAGQQLPVHLSLTVPADAERGEYHALLEARAVPGAGSGQGAAMGVAASTDLRFAVDADGGESAAGSSSSTSGHVPMWAGILAVVAVALSGLIVVLRRAGISVSVERRA